MMLVYVLQTTVPLILILWLAFVTKRRGADLPQISPQRGLQC